MEVEAVAERRIRTCKEEVVVVVEANAQRRIRAVAEVAILRLSIVKGRSRMP